MSPKEELDGFLDKYEPAIAARARRVLKEVRARTPGAVELVNDNYNALAIGFGPTEKTSEAVLSVAVWPRSVMLYFLKGATLADPDGLLKGSGSRGRHIPDVDKAAFAAPGVEALIARAIALAEPPFNPKAKRRLLIKSVSAKQRPRRPAPK